ncbi:MAG: orotidine-5'-phosphate decarboxylase [Deltaproteobacteria bacterium]|nr:orotidine-5'-phosphate decarboxylase [Deltaproteobacteria bacterium]
MPPKLVFALDVPGKKTALAWADRLSGLVPVYKVGLELFTAEGPGLVRELKGRGLEVFLDLKFLDIPATVRRAMERVAALGADLATVHATGGPEMLAAAVEGARGQVKVLGVTLLTSIESHGRPSQDIVLDRAEKAAAAGLSGVVCSGREAAAVKKQYPSLLVACPGIRPAGGDAGDQKRVVTPAGAAAAGADYVVVGRPIRDAKDPEAVVKAILEEMGQG